MSGCVHPDGGHRSVQQWGAEEGFVVRPSEPQFVVASLETHFIRIATEAGGRSRRRFLNVVPAIDVLSLLNVYSPLTLLSKPLASTKCPTLGLALRIAVGLGLGLGLGIIRSILDFRRRTRAIRRRTDIDILFVLIWQQNSLLSRPSGQVLTLHEDKL